MLEDLINFLTEKGVVIEWVETPVIVRNGKAIPMQSWQFYTLQEVSEFLSGTSFTKFYMLALKAFISTDVNNYERRETWLLRGAFA